MKPVSDQEENELVILHLRQLCEAKQKAHAHIGEGPAVRTGFPRPAPAVSLCLVTLSQEIGEDLLPLWSHL